MALIDQAKQALEDAAKKAGKDALDKLTGANKKSQDPGNRLPESKYKTEYPMCQTHVSRSGHEKHIDDTPGHERLREAHKAGTYWEISEDGRKVELIVANEYHYVKGGL